MSFWQLYVLLETIICICICGKEKHFLREEDFHSKVSREIGEGSIGVYFDRIEKRVNLKKVI